MFSISDVITFTSAVAEQKFQTTHVTVFRRLCDSSHWTQKTHLPFLYEGKSTNVQCEQQLLQDAGDCAYLH